MTIDYYGCTDDQYIPANHFLIIQNNTTNKRIIIKNTLPMTDGAINVSDSAYDKEMSGHKISQIVQALFTNTNTEYTVIMSNYDSTSAQTAYDDDITQMIQWGKAATIRYNDNTIESISRTTHAHIFCYEQNSNQSEVCYSALNVACRCQWLDDCSMAVKSALLIEPNNIKTTCTKHTPNKLGATQIILDLLDAILFGAIGISIFTNGGVIFMIATGVLLAGIGGTWVLDVVKLYQHSGELSSKEIAACIVDMLLKGSGMIVAILTFLNLSHVFSFSPMLQISMLFAMTAAMMLATFTDYTICIHE
jgi:hypothetical protein